MKLNLQFIAFLSAFFWIVSCRTESQENPRAYVEGKIIYSSIDTNLYRLKILSGSTIVAETTFETGGSFKLSGPVSNDGFTIASTEKIKSFSADKTGLTLSKDALQINIPKGITYLKFNEIVLEK
ncbi:hypothetical protein CBW16_07185 [Flavobacteriaceae bacterium JJC]|nr:hypothetical protein CBW16_07185 [Flavobacteriaceae bacterium JJC]